MFIFLGENYKMKKAILFDAYGTLFNEGKESVPIIAEDIVRKFELKTSPQEFFDEWKAKYLCIEERVFFNRQPFKTIKEINLESLASVFEKFSVKGSPSEFIDKLFYLWSFPKLFSEIRGVLSELKKDYVLGILSNTENKTLFSAVKYTGIEVDYILTSEEAKIYKPNSEIFLRACNDLGLNQNEAIYVGNSLSDIIGAKKAGLTMIHANRRRELLSNRIYLPDYEIKSLRPLPKIMRKIKNGKLAGI